MSVRRRNVRPKAADETTEARAAVWEMKDEALGRLVLTIHLLAGRHGPPHQAGGAQL